MSARAAMKVLAWPAARDVALATLPNRWVVFDTPSRTLVFAFDGRLALCLNVFGMLPVQRYLRLSSSTGVRNWPDPRVGASRGCFRPRNDYQRRAPGNPELFPTLSVLHKAEKKSHASHLPVGDSC